MTQITTFTFDGPINMDKHDEIASAAVKIAWEQSAVIVTELNRREAERCAIFNADLGRMDNPPPEHVDVGGLTILVGTLIALIKSMANEGHSGTDVPEMLDIAVKSLVTDICPPHLAQIYLLKVAADLGRERAMPEAEKPVKIDDQTADSVTKLLEEIRKKKLN